MANPTREGVAAIPRDLNEYEALLDVEEAARQLVRRDVPMSVVALCESNLIAALAAVEALRG